MKHLSIIGLLTVAAVIFLCVGTCACRKNPAENPSASTETTRTTDSAESSNTTTPTTTVKSDTAPEKTAVGDSKNQATDEKLAATAKLAESLVGKPYLYGAKGPDAFDNSGFLVYCYGQNGVTVPRKTADIAKQGTAVDKANLKPGDAVFFYNENPGAVEYAGIYIGNNRFAACDNENKPVSVHSLDGPYFTEHFLFARRF